MSISKHHARSKALLAIVVILGSIGAPLSVDRAFAATGDVTCIASGQINFSPALTATNATSTAALTGSFAGCISLNGRYPNLKSAVSLASGTATSATGLNPCSLLLTIQLNDRDQWSPSGQGSQAIITVNTNPANGPITVSSRVTSGVLAGDTGTFPAVLTPNLDCAVNGLTSLTAATGLAVFG